MIHGKARVKMLDGWLVAGCTDTAASSLFPVLSALPLDFERAHSEFEPEGTFRDLFAAASEGLMKLLKKEVKKGYNVKAVSTEQGKSLLFHAAVGGRAEAVEFLLSKGADYRVGDRSGYLPLDAACYSGNVVRSQPLHFDVASLAATPIMSSRRLWPKRRSDASHAEVSPNLLYGLPRVCDP